MTPLRLHSGRSRGAIVTALICAAPGLARAADPYDRALGLAREAGARGDWRGAATALESAAEAYPQDYAIALALGDARLRANEIAGSERAYRAALDRAPTSRDARLGLAWSLAREGDCASAGRELGAAAGDGVDLARRDGAARAVTACPFSPAGPWSIGAAWDRLWFPSHPYKSSGTGVFAEVARSFGDRFAVDAAYRFVRYAVTSSPYVTPFDQHEAYARAGLDSTRAALLAEGAVVGDGSGLYGLSGHAGATARWSAYGDAILHGAVSVYRDRLIGRVAPEWRVPIAGPLAITPGVAAQFAEGRVFPHASLSASLAWPALSAWVGAKIGAEVRPAYLESHVVYDLPERVAFGAWAGVQVRVSRVLAAQVTYAFDRLRRTDAALPAESDVHALALGPSLRF